MPNRAIVTPIDYWKTSVAIATVMTEAQRVVSLRMLGMAGVLDLGRNENRRMVTEKAAAARAAGLAAARAAMAGAGPGEITRAAIGPVQRRTKANVRRLAKHALNALP